MILSSERSSVYFSGSGGDGGSGNQGGKGTSLGGERPKEANLVQDEDSGAGSDAGSGTKKGKASTALGGSRPKK